MPESAPTSVAAEDTTLSFDQGVDDITALLNGPDDPAPAQEDEAPVDNEGQGDEPGPDDVDAPVDAAAEAEEATGQQAPGQFVPDQGNVRLKDGTVISVTDLKRGYLAQRDYFRQTGELRSLEENVKADRAKVDDFARTLMAEREQFLSVVKELLPAQPDRAMLDQSSGKFDPIGYQIAQAAYEEKAQALRQIWQQHQAGKQRETGESEQARQAARRQEQERLYQAIPEFRDEAKYAAFRTEARDVMSRIYGFSDDELSQIEDHRYVRVINDVLRLQKALSRAPKVKQEVSTKPVLKGGVRMDPKALNSRENQSRKERLRQTGDFDDGVSAIQALIS